MQSQILNLFLGQNNPATANILRIAKGTGLIELAMQGYQAYQCGKLPDFVSYQYENNINFRKFYDKHKNETFQEFFQKNNINLE